MSIEPSVLPSAAGAGHATVIGTTSEPAPRVYRQYRRADEFDALQRALGDAWLGPRERAELAAWRDQRRRRAWMLSRIIGKQLIATLDKTLRPDQIEILSRDTEGRVNRPRVWCNGVERPWSLSISHSHRGVLAALAATHGVSIGVDVADCETFSDGFVDLWFTAAERAWFHDTQSPGIACFIWAAKEAIYKACNDGDSFAPREIEVLPDGRCRYRNVSLPGCRLQSWTLDGHLAVLATASGRLSIQV